MKILIMLMALGVAAVAATPQEAYESGYQAVKDIVKVKRSISGESPEMTIQPVETVEPVEPTVETVEPETTDEWDRQADEWDRQADATEEVFRTKRRFFRRRIR